MSEARVVLTKKKLEQQINKLAERRLEFIDKVKSANIEVSNIKDELKKFKHELGAIDELLKDKFMALSAKGEKDD